MLDVTPLQVLPFLLVMVAGFCFAIAAIVQHGVVAAGAGEVSGALRVRSLRDVLRSSVWWAGLALATGGSLLHAGALVLAPLSVVQPVAVLAMPIAVVLAALHTRRRPSPGMAAGVILSGTAVVVFVVAAMDSADTPTAPDSTAAVGVGVVGLLVAVLAGVGLSSSGWTRCVACAMAGGVAFGLVSALMRTAAQAITVTGVEFWSATILGIGLAMATASLTGGWLIQQAFASGPPEVVVACLTAVDPIVAVAFGVVVLGEGHPSSFTHWAVLMSAAAGAVIGVAVLARHHPDATARS